MDDLKYRHEYKHIIMLSDAFAIRARLSPIMEPDENALRDGKYLIRSLYFDTPEDRALMEKFAGDSVREKFRIRYYNFNTDFIRLEKKMKNNRLATKLSAEITKKDTERIISGDIEFLKNSPVTLNREFYLKLKTERLIAKTIVDYTREAFTFYTGNIRVTIDSRIKTAVGSVDLFNPDIPTIDVLDDNSCVLEVKFDEFLPDFIQYLIQLRNCSSSSTSKYAVSRKYF